MNRLPPEVRVLLLQECTKHGIDAGSYFSLASCSKAFHALSVAYEKQFLVPMFESIRPAESLRYGRAIVLAESAMSSRSTRLSPTEYKEVFAALYKPIGTNLDLDKRSFRMVKDIRKLAQWALAPYLLSEEFYVSFGTRFQVCAENRCLEAWLINRFEVYTQKIQPKLDKPPWREYIKVSCYLAGPHRSTWEEAVLDIFDMNNNEVHALIKIEVEKVIRKMDTTGALNLTDAEYMTEGYRAYNTGSYEFLADSILQFLTVKQLLMFAFEPASILGLATDAMRSLLARRGHPKQTIPGMAYSATRILELLKDWKRYLNMAAKTSLPWDSFKTPHFQRLAKAALESRQSPTEGG